MRAFQLAALLGFFACLLCRPAGAVTLQDTTDAFRLEFEPSGARVCEVLPAGQSKPADCEGVALDAVQSSTSAADQLIAVDHVSSRYLLSYMRQPKDTWIREVINQVLLQYPEAEVTNKYAEALSKWRIGDAEVVRLDHVVTRSSTASEPLEVISYLINGKSALHLLRISAPPSAAAAARRDVDRALPTLQVEVSAMALVWVYFTRLWPYALTLWVLGAVLAAYFAFRRRRPRSKEHAFVRGVR